MKILVINAGSSSMKFTLFEMETQSVLAKGVFERIGADNPNLIYKKPDGTPRLALPLKDGKDLRYPVGRIQIQKP